jgi:hypothetical protein
MLLQENINQIQLRIDNVYDKIVELEERHGGEK